MNSKTVQAVQTLLENNLNFRVQVTLEDAQVILSEFLVYNGMPDSMDGLVDRVKLAVGPMNFGPNNPNTGNFDHIRFSIGNENSLVVYVEVAGAYLKGQGISVAAKLERVGDAFSADEISNEIDGLGGVSVRLWWD